jgi:hypothetical protein
MAGLVPAIHVFLRRNAVKTWMPGTSPGMTEKSKHVIPGHVPREPRPGNDSSLQKRPIEAHLLDERFFVGERALKYIERGDLA